MGLHYVEDWFDHQDHVEATVADYGVIVDEKPIFAVEYQEANLD